MLVVAASAYDARELAASIRQPVEHWAAQSVDMNTSGPILSEWIGRRLPGGRGEERRA